MSPRRRALRTLDATRLGQAASRVGIDPRTWVSLGVVEEIAYSASDGFMLAVRMVQGALAGETCACELAHLLAPADVLLSAPFTSGDVAVCVLPAGDANAMPVVIGFLRSPEAPAPNTVNGRAINAALLELAFVLAAPGHEAELELGPVRLTAPSIKLGPVPDPTQPFVRGQALADTLGAFCTALGQFTAKAATASAAASAVCKGPLAPLGAFFDALTPALTSLGTEALKLKAELVPGRVLSTQITGE